jgi:hypothetical protein
VHDGVELRDGPDMASQDRQREPSRNLEGQHGERGREVVAYRREGVRHAPCVRVRHVGAEQRADGNVEREARHLFRGVDHAVGRPARDRGGGALAHRAGIPVEARRGEARIEQSALPLPRLAFTQQETMSEHVRGAA